MTLTKEYMNTKMLLTLIAIIAISGCTDSKEKNKVVFKEAPSTNIQTESLKESGSETEEIKNDITFKIRRLLEINEDLSNFNEYVRNLNKHIVSAEITGKSLPGTTLSCLLRDNVLAISTFNNDSNKAELQFGLSADSANLNEVNCKVVTESKEVIFTKNFIIKKDIYIGNSGSYDVYDVGLFPGKNEVGALVIDKDTTLVTQGEHIKIDMTELVAQQGAVIETFRDSDLESTPGILGESGGKIEMSTKKSVGYLTVKLKGKHSGDSRDIEDTYRSFDYSHIDRNRCLGVSDYTHRLTHEYVYCPPLSIEHCPEKKVKQVAVRFEVINFNTEAKKGLKGGGTGSFFFTTNDLRQMLPEVIKLPGNGGIGGKNYNAESLQVDYIRGTDHPHYTYGVGWPRGRSLGNYVGWLDTEISIACNTFVRIQKGPSPSTPKIGVTGDQGEVFNACFSSHETKEQFCN